MFSRRAITVTAILYYIFLKLKKNLMVKEFTRTILEKIANDTLMYDEKSAWYSICRQFSNSWRFVLVTGTQWLAN